MRSGGSIPDISPSAEQAPIRGVGAHAERRLRPQGLPRTEQAPIRGESAHAERGSIPDISPSAEQAPIRGESAHAERGLRPQGAPAPQRGHSPASVSAKAPDTLKTEIREALPREREREAA